MFLDGCTVGGICTRACKVTYRQSQWYHVSVPIRTVRMYVLYEGTYVREVGHGVTRVRQPDPTYDSVIMLLSRN